MAEHGDGRAVRRACQHVMGVSVPLVWGCSIEEGEGEGDGVDW